MNISSSGLDKDLFVLVQVDARVDARKELGLLDELDAETSLGPLSDGLRLLLKKQSASTALQLAAKMKEYTTIAATSKNIQILHLTELQGHQGGRILSKRRTNFIIIRVSN